MTRICECGCAEEVHFREVYIVREPVNLGGHRSMVIETVKTRRGACGRCVPCNGFTLRTIATIVPVKS